MESASGPPAQPAQPAPSRTGPSRTDPHHESFPMLVRRAEEEAQGEGEGEGEVEGEVEGAMEEDGGGDDLGELEPEHDSAEKDDDDEEGGVSEEYLQALLNRKLSEVESKLPEVAISPSEIVANMPQRLRARLPHQDDFASLRAEVTSRQKLLFEDAKAHLSPGEFKRFKADTLSHVQAFLDNAKDSAAGAGVPLDELTESANKVLGRATAVVAARKELRAKLTQVMAEARQHLTREELLELREKAREQLRGLNAQVQDFDPQEVAAKAQSVLLDARKRVAKKVDSHEIKEVLEAKLKQAMEKAKTVLPPDQVKKLRALVRGRLRDLYARMDEMGSDEIRDTARNILEVMQGGAKGLFESAKKAAGKVQDIVESKKQELVDRSEKLREKLSAMTDTASVIKVVMMQNVGELRSTVAQLVQSEMMDITRAVHQVLVSRSSLPTAEESLNYVIAGIIAPVMVKLEYWAVQFTFAHSLVLLVAALAVLLVDWSNDCDVDVGPIGLNVYFLVFGAVQLVNVVTRLHFFLQLHRFWSDYSFEKIFVQEGLVRSELQGVGAMAQSQQSALQEMLEDMTEIGEEAVALKYHMERSVVAVGLVPMHLFFTAWRCLGCVMWYDLQCTDCDKGNMEYLLAATCLEFMLFLTYHVVYLVAWIALAFVNLTRKDRVVKWAKDFDKGHFGFPLAEGVVMQLVVRDAEHVNRIIANRRRHKIATLERRQRILRQEIDDIDVRIRIGERQVNRMKTRSVKRIRSNIVNRRVSSLRMKDADLVE